MRVLYLIRDPYPTARPDIWALFAIRLAERGIRSDIVAIRRGNERAPAEGWPAGAEIVEPRTRLPGLGSLQGFWHDVRALRRADQYDAVVLRDKIVSAAVALLLVDRRRVFYWMSFPFPVEDLQRAATPGGNPLFRFALRVRGLVSAWLLDRFVVPRARAVFVQSEAMRREVARTSGRQRGLVAVPMGVDPAMFDGPRPVRTDETAIDAAAARADAIHTQTTQRSLRPFRLVYLGSLDRARRIDFLLQVLVWLRAQPGGDAYHLTLIGGASTPSEMQWVEQQVGELDLRNSVTMTGQIPMADACRLAQQCDAGLSAIPRGALFDVSSPTKTVEYLAMGLPVVVNDVPDQAFLIEHTRAGICVPMDVPAFGTAIRQLRDQYAEFSDRANKSRAWIFSERGYPALADRVAGVLAGAGQHGVER